MSAWHLTDPALKGLLADICANPDDDTLRLIYADRVDELDNAPSWLRTQARFIRASIKVARWQLRKAPARTGKLGDPHLSDQGKVGFVMPQSNGLPTVWGVDSWTAQTLELANEDPELERAQREQLACFQELSRLPYLTALDTGVCGSCGGDGFATGPPENRPCRRCKCSGRRIWNHQASGQWQWDRGFLCHVVMDGIVWCRYAATLLDRFPLIKVTLTVLPNVRRTRTGKHHVGRHRASLDIQPRRWFDYAVFTGGPNGVSYTDYVNNAWLAADLCHRTWPSIRQWYWPTVGEEQPEQEES